MVVSQKQWRLENGNVNENQEEKEIGDGFFGWKKFLHGSACANSKVGLIKNREQ